MQSQNEPTVKVLNSLIETTLDSANGYKDAADGTSDQTLKTMFAERAQKRREISRELQEEVRTFGGQPTDDQSMMGKLHNKFAEMRGKLMGESDDGVIDEVERGEDMIKAKFEKAARDENLAEGARRVVEKAYASIKADHDTISALKHSRH